MGSWEAVYDLASKDADGNASCNELIAENSRGNYVDAQKPVALVGVENLVIVDTADALLVASRSLSARCQQDRQTSSIPPTAKHCYRSTVIGDMIERGGHCEACPRSRLRAHRYC